MSNWKKIKVKKKNSWMKYARNKMRKKSVEYWETSKSKSQNIVKETCIR